MTQSLGQAICYLESSFYKSSPGILNWIWFSPIFELISKLEKLKIKKSLKIEKIKNLNYNRSLSEATSNFTQIKLLIFVVLILALFILKSPFLFIRTGSVLFSPDSIIVINIGYS